MKTHIIFFLSCFWCISAITVHYQPTTSSEKSPKEYKTTLKDIRLVPISDSETTQEVQKSKQETSIRRQNPQTKSRGTKKKFTPTISRTGSTQNIQHDPNHVKYMQKMANQLFMAQKHASLLSDYQKFILNQDQDVKNFVLAKAIQERNPKPFSRRGPTGRALSTQANVKQETQDPVTAANNDYKKIVVVTPTAQTAAPIISKPQNDNLAQPTQIKYVTLAPQSLTHFAESQKVTVVPYHSPQQYVYYDLGVTAKPQVVTSQASLGLSSYESPKYYTSEGGHEEDSPHHDANYEFMYNVKDHEKHNHFGHKESRSDKTTYGFYFVHLPDGRLETVRYWADKTGYHAKVDYQGEAKHPTESDHKLHSLNLLHH